MVYSDLFDSHAPTLAIHTLSLHDALPICWPGSFCLGRAGRSEGCDRAVLCGGGRLQRTARSHPSERDRKSTRLNSSHQISSYAVFCLKKKSKIKNTER